MTNSVKPIFGRIQINMLLFPVKQLQQTYVGCATFIKEIESERMNFMPEKVKNRVPSMDFVRCCALFFVVTVHFFLHTGYYDWPVVGFRMYIMTVLRSYLMICVPLFIVLSGYLTCKKTISLAYYKKIFYTIWIYILASACCYGYKVVFQDVTFSFSDFVLGLMKFSSAPYSWYVELYLGLFLLTPLLNALYNGLKNQREKQVLLGTLILLTAMPHVVNIYVDDLKWFANPASSRAYVKILPTYWTGLYPITYYFIGCYLREFKLKLTIRGNLLLSLLVFIMNGTFNYYRSYGACFVKGPWQENGSLLILIQTVLFFSFFDNLQEHHFPKWTSRILPKISSLCFGAYLLSWVFDITIYEWLTARVSPMPLRLNYLPLTVPLVYISALALSWIIHQIYYTSGKLFAILCHKK